jgi:hypothetical protein
MRQLQEYASGLSKMSDVFTILPEMVVTNLGILSEVLFSAMLRWVRESRAWKIGETVIR